MYIKALLITAISATAMSQDISFSLDFGSVASQFSIGGEDISVLSVLATALPPSLVTAITDPAVQASLQSEFQAGVTPSWYGALPSGVKSYLGEAGSALETNLPISSIDSALSSIASSVSGSVNSQLSSLSSRASISAAATSDSGSDSSSSSTGGAPAPTGAVVASVAGAFGVLALAIGL